MTEQDEKQLWLEIKYIFDSGANELRVFNMVKTFIEGRYQALHIHDVSNRKFNLDELRHIAVNYAITCEKGYNGDFDSWFNGISGEWRKIANRKQ